jgi:hypothetical protein
MRRGTPLTVLALLLLIPLLIAGCGGGDDGGAAADGPLIGIQDDRIANPDSDPAERVALADTLDAPAMRVDLRWDLVAPTQPADPRDPGDPAYVWDRYDAIIDAASARDIEVLFTIWGTPPWAVDPDAPDEGFPQWGRRPLDTAAPGAFAEAAARRYAPRGVRRWEAWNEPNIPLFLRPQYERRGERWVAVSPDTYSEMATAIHAGIKAADPDAVVAGGVTAPAGNREPSGTGSRVPPQEFVRLLSRPGLRPPMDAYAHHPYPITTPRKRNNPRASYVDLYNLEVLTGALDAGYLAGKPLWLTEFGLGTRGVTNYRFHVSRERQAELLDDAFRRVRANPRVQVFVWYLLQDHLEWSSGLLDETGAEKPSAAAFRAQVSGG